MQQINKWIGTGPPPAEEHTVIEFSPKESYLLFKKKKKNSKP
jgi:hypothetical protein